jgi:hypothetical protein
MIFVAVEMGALEGWRMERVGMRMISVEKILRKGLGIEPGTLIYAFVEKMGKLPL